MKFRTILALAVITLPIIATAQGQSFEVAVSGAYAACAIPESNFPGGIQWFNPDSVQADGAFSIASDGGNVFGVVNTFPSTFRVQYYPEPASPVTIYSSSGYSVSSIAASRGRIFLSARALPGGVNAFLLVLSPDQVLEATYPMAFSDDLAAAFDGCTLYHWSRDDPDTIGRINGCTGAPLAPFATFAEPIFDVHPLTDGTVLVAAGTAIHQLNAAGVIIRTIPLSNFTFDAPYGAFPLEVALSADRVLYIAVGNDCDMDQPLLLRVAFDTGLELSRRPLEFGIANGMVLGPASHAPVPTLGDVGLLLVTIAIAAVGLIALRR